MSHVPCIYEFGDFRFIPSESQLLHNGAPISLPAKALETLFVLVRENGHLVEKAVLINLVWGDAFVEEGNIAKVISTLRRALGDARSEHRYIETVSKRGYRFVADVRIVDIKPATESIVEYTPVRDMPPPNFPASVIWGIFGIGALFLIIVMFAEVSKRKVPAFTLNPSPLSSTRQENHIDSSNAEARQFYTEGRYYANRATQEGLHRGIEYFQQAVLRDPKYAEAYAGLADSYSWLEYHETGINQDEYKIAKNAAQKAVELDDTLAESHTSLGQVHLSYEWQIEEAEREFRRSIELNPNYALAYVEYANCLAVEGRLDEALTQVQRAREVDPVSAVANTDFAYILYLNRQYEKAASVLQHSIDLAPDYALAHIKLGVIYALEKNYADALRESQKVDQLSPGDPRLEGLSGYIEARAGKTNLARARLRRLAEYSEHDHAASFGVAIIYAGLNQDEQAIDWLERSYQEHAVSLLFANVEPVFDSERSNPRFIALIAKLRVTGASGIHER